MEIYIVYSLHTHAVHLGEASTLRLLQERQKEIPVNIPGDKTDPDSNHFGRRKHGDGTGERGRAFITIRVWEKKKTG